MRQPEGSLFPAENSPRNRVDVPLVARYTGNVNTELLSIKEAAGQLRLHEKHVSRLCRQGTLPAKLVGGGYVITAEDLAAFAALERKPGRPRKSGEAR